MIQELQMDQVSKQFFQEIIFNNTHIDTWVIMESSSEDSSKDSGSSLSLSSSSDLLEDASSSSTSWSSLSSSSSSHSKEPLYDLSELMLQLPIKRGLSKYYQGKSQSYASLASVKSIEDLAKKKGNTTTYSKRIKSCKNFVGGLDGHKFYTTPKATISKKSAPKVSLLGNKSSTLMTKCKPQS